MDQGHERGLHQYLFIQLATVNEEIENRIVVIEFRSSFGTLSVTLSTGAGTCRRTEPLRFTFFKISTNLRNGNCDFWIDIIRMSLVEESISKIKNARR